MGKLFQIIFVIYHLIFGSQVAHCRFNPTCSQYLLDATCKYGSFKGSFLAVKRILSCHPLSTKPYYDPA